MAQDGADLSLAPDHLRGDREVVMTAVADWGCALEFATEELRGDPGTGASILLAGMNLTRNTSPPPLM